MPIKKVNRAFNSLGLNGNFLNSHVEVGTIYRIDDGIFNPRTHISLETGIDFSQHMKVGVPADLSLQRESSVAINLGANASSPIGDTEVEILFGARNSWIVSLKNATETYIYEQALIDHCRDVWQRLGYDKKPMRYVIVTAVIWADSGSILYSEERNNRVVLESELNIPVTSALQLNSGQFSIEINTKGILESTVSVKHVPLFKALRLRNNGQFELYG